MQDVTHDEDERTASMALSENANLFQIGIFSLLSLNKVLQFIEIVTLYTAVSSSINTCLFACWLVVCLVALFVYVCVSFDYVVLFFAQLQAPF